MAEGFDSAYHVRQQSRREKLRVQDSTTTSTTNNNLYDPSSLIFSSELLTNAAFKTTSNSANNNVQEERMTVMGYISSNSSPSTKSHNFYMDPPSLQDFNDNNNNNPYLIMSPSNLRVSDQSLNFNNNGGLGVLSNAQGCLSLSLSSQQQQQQQNVSVSSTTNQLQQRYDHHHAVPLGPFTGYASILKGSRFLKPAQKMLEEICDVGGNNYVEKITGDSVLLDPLPSSSSLDSLQRNEGDHGDPSNSKKSKLLWMLDEVYRRYKQYYQQMQEVVASFESVAGLSNIAPFANLALRAMSKHFRFLKDAITDQLQFTNKSYGQRNCANDETPRTGDPDACLYAHKPIQSIGFNDHHPVWRPQRGLPERAVTVLRAWLFEHFLHPYPTDTDKLMLAKQTGLSRNQVSNWFINARVRVWKPMVEEIHTLETTEGQKPSQKEQQNVNKSNDHLFASQNPSTSTQKVKDLPNKRSRDDYSNHVMGGEAPTNILYGNPSRHPQTEIGMNGVLGSVGGVSLTLGLHQNDGMGITTEPFAINAARRFGLEAGNEGFVMGHFEAQNTQQFSREYMVGQVQLLHDFVG